MQLSGKKTLTIVLLSAVTIAAVILASWVYSHRPGRFVEHKKLDTQSVSTDGWQTFTPSNAVFLFTFQYPKIWQLSKETSLPNPDASLRPTQLVTFTTPDGKVANFGFEQRARDDLAMKTILPDPLSYFSKLTLSSSNNLAGSHYTFNQVFLARTDQRTVVVAGGYFSHKLWTVTAHVFENDHFLTATTTCGLEATDWSCDERLITTILSTIKLPK